MTAEIARPVALNNYSRTTRPRQLLPENDDQPVNSPRDRRHQGKECDDSLDRIQLVIVFMMACNRQHIINER